jgi:hypothetical protein
MQPQNLLTLPLRLVARHAGGLPAWFSALAASLVVALLLVVAETLILTLRTPNISLPFERSETAFLLRGFHAVEHDTRGGYRWSAGESLVRFDQPGGGGRLVFGVQLGAPPPASPADTFRLGFGSGSEYPPLTIALSPLPRAYYVLVPPEAARAGTLFVGLASETTSVPPDTRSVGLRVEEVSLRFLGTLAARPTTTVIALQVAFLALWALLLWRLGAAARLLVLLLLVVAVLLLLFYWWRMLLLPVYLARFVVALALLTGLTWVLLPLAERHWGWVAPPHLMRLLWGVAVLACTLRLVGSLYPLFHAYDLMLNVGRFVNTLHGSLVAFNNAIEFRNGVTVYPAGPYVLLLPGVLARLPAELVVQGGLAIIDGAGALLVAVMARSLGTSHRAAIFSALLYAAIPINLTALWYGLTAQIFGQALMLPLLVALLLALPHARHRGWVAAGVLLSMALVSHIGVAILAVAWLGVAWVVLRVRGTTTPAAWWSYTAVLVSGCLVGFVLVYSPVLALKVDQAFKVGEKITTSNYVPAYSLIYRGFRIAFHEMGFWMLSPGLVLLLMRRNLPRGGIELVGSWLGVVALFWGVEMVTALQVRYIYFLTPLACIAIGLLLDRLAARGQIPRVLAGVVLLLLLVQGCAYWYRGTFEGVMMAVSPLLR